MRAQSKRRRGRSYTSIVAALFSARVAGITLLAVVGAFGHVIYPSWMALRSRRLAAPDPPVPNGWPGVSVVVPAFRERNVIAAKIEDIAGNGYPGPLQTIVVADDPETAEAARATQAEVIDANGRLGKAEAINRGLAAARNPIVVLTDANARIRPGAIAALVRWFEDESVGAVAGEKRVLGDSQAPYWRFESWLKRCESRSGTTIGLVGELAALRRELHRPLPRDVWVDDLWLALDVIDSGSRILYDDSALADEDPSPSWRDEWERRTRIVSGALDVLWRRRSLLVPGRSPVALQLWGHRLVRSSFGPLSHAALLLVAVRASRRSLLASAFCIGHAAAAVALARQLRGKPVSRGEMILAQVLFLQAVGIGGTFRWLRGDRPALWPKGDRPPGTFGNADDGA
jgi:cellulose synthase/poly-beta-1,6-N-acetylglucosamine synthase-like glycosyltransferase